MRKLRHKEVKWFLLKAIQLENSKTGLESLCSYLLWKKIAIVRNKANEKMYKHLMEKTVKSIERY